MKKFLIFGIMILLNLVNAAGSLLAADLTHWYYTMDNAEVSGSTLLDLTDYNNNAEIHGATTGVSGIYNEAFEFDGTDDYLVTPNFNSGAGNWTLNTWINPDTINQNEIIMSCDNAALTFHIDGVATPSTSYRIYTGPTNGWVFDAASGDFSTGSWQMFTLSYNEATNNLIMFANGVQVESTTTTFDGGGADCRIGTRADSTSGRNYDGGIDEFSIFNTTLDQTQINYLYNSGSPGENQQYPYNVTPPTINFTNISVNGQTFTNHSYLNTSNTSWYVEVLNTSTNGNINISALIVNESDAVFYNNTFANNSLNGTFDLNSLSDGEYTATFYAYNNETNVTSSGNHFHIDSTPAVITFNNNSEFPTYTINLSDLNITANDSNFANMTIDWDDTTSNFTNMTTFTGFKTFATNGNHSFIITAYDLADNHIHKSGNLFINPYAYFYFQLANGTAVTNFSLNNVSYGFYVDLQIYDLGLGNHSFQFAKLGYITQNFSITFTNTSQINQTFNVSQARINLNIYDRATENLLTGTTNIEIQGAIGYNGSTNTGQLEIIDINFNEGIYRIIATHDDYGTEEYAFNFTNRENATINIYMLNTTPTANQVQEIIVRNENNYLVEGSYVYLEAWKPASSSYELRSMGISNGQGKVYFNVEVGSVLYRISGETAIRSGSLTPAVIYDTTDALTLKITLNQTAITQILEHFEGSFTENVSGNQSYLRFQFQDTDNLVSQACIKIYRFGPREVTNQTCVSAASGILYYTLDINKSYSQEARAYVTIDGREEQIGESFYYNAFHQLDLKGLEWILPVVFIFAGISFGLWLESPYIIGIAIAGAYYINLRMFKNIYSVNVVVIITLIMFITWWATTRKGD